MVTLQVGVWAEHTGIGNSQWAAATMGIWQDKGGLTTQWGDKKVRELIWEIPKSVGISNNQGLVVEQWDLLIDRCITLIGSLEFNRQLLKQYWVHKTIIDGQKLKAHLDEVAEIGFAIQAWLYCQSPRCRLFGH